MLFQETVFPSPGAAYSMGYNYFRKDTFGGLVMAQELKSGQILGYLDHGHDESSPPEGRTSLSGSVISLIVGNWD